MLNTNQENKSSVSERIPFDVNVEMLALWRSSDRNWEFYIKDSNEYRRSSWEGF